MRGNSLKPTEEDREEVRRVFKKLKAECQGQIFLRHDKRRNYKDLEVICQLPVKLIED